METTRTVPAPTMACPNTGCLVFPYDTAEQVAEHLARDECVYEVHRSGRSLVEPTPPARTSGTGSATTAVVDPRHEEALAYARSYAGSFGFMVDMRAKAQKSGATLSPKMVDAILRCKARDAAWAAERQTKAAATPAATEVPDVPAGRYAVENEDGDLRFYKVDRPEEGRWAGYTFLSVQASDEFHPIKGSARAVILGKIAVDPKAASARYGTLLGSCGVCGRTLTDETSRARGIGPECARRF